MALEGQSGKQRVEVFGRDSNAFQGDSGDVTCVCSDIDTDVGYTENADESVARAFVLELCITRSLHCGGDTSIGLATGTVGSVWVHFEELAT
jgi:hypothetical protein